jgi:hypothetical protein
MSDGTILYDARMRNGWGFVLYRQDYSNDATWAIALNCYKNYMLAKYASEDDNDDEDMGSKEVGDDQGHSNNNETKWTRARHEEDEDEDEEEEENEEEERKMKLKKAATKALFKVKVFDRREQFEGKSVDEIREHYLEWFQVWGRLFMDIPNRERAFIYFDTESIQSLVNVPVPRPRLGGGFVKVVDAEWDPVQEAKHEEDFHARRLGRGYMPPREDGGMAKVNMECLSSFWHSLVASPFET